MNYCTSCDVPLEHDSTEDCGAYAEDRVKVLRPALVDAQSFIISYCVCPDSQVKRATLKKIRIALDTI